MPEGGGEGRVEGRESERKKWRVRDEEVGKRDVRSELCLHSVAIIHVLSCENRPRKYRTGTHQPLEYPFHLLSQLVFPQSLLKHPMYNQIRTITLNNSSSVGFTNNMSKVRTESHRPHCAKEWCTGVIPRSSENTDSAGLTFVKKRRKRGDKAVREEREDVSVGGGCG